MSAILAIFVGRFIMLFPNLYFLTHWRKLELNPQPLRHVAARQTSRHSAKNRTRGCSSRVVWSPAGERKWTKTKNSLVRSPAGAIIKKVYDFGDLDLVDEPVEEREAAAFAVLDPVGGRGWGRLLDHLVGEAPDGAQEESKWPETEAHLEQGPA